MNMEIMLRDQARQLYCRPFYLRVRLFITYLLWKICKGAGEILELRLYRLVRTGSINIRPLQ